MPNKFTAMQKIPSTRFSSTLLNKQPQFQKSNGIIHFQLLATTIYEATPSKFYPNGFKPKKKALGNGTMSQDVAKQGGEGSQALMLGLRKQHETRAFCRRSYPFPSIPVQRWLVSNLGQIRSQKNL